MDAPLDKINDIIIGQKLVGKILGYSRIIIFTSSSKYVYDFISNAEVFRDYLNDYSEKFKHRKTENDKVVLSKYDELNKLKDLYEKDELTSVVNRVVEDINHRFTIDVLTKNFKSHDLGISANNLRKDRENPNDILDRMLTYNLNDNTFINFVNMMTKASEDFK